LGVFAELGAAEIELEEMSCEERMAAIAEAVMKNQ
jgi:hypothetical protein